MKIKQLNIENYRGFEQASITFPDNNLAVFIGTNGAGKTSVLDLVANLCADFLAYASASFIRIEDGAEKKEGERNSYIKIFHPFRISERDINIHNNTIQTVNNLELKFQELDKVTINTRVALVRDRFRKITSVDLHNQPNLIFEVGLNKKININLPIFAYYSIYSNRSRVGIRGNKIVNEYIYEDLEGTTTDDNVLKHWFKEEEDSENREKVRRQDLQFTNNRLEVLRLALEIFFGKIENTTFQKLRVFERERTTFSFNKTFVQISLVVDKNGKTFEIDSLSSGEKSLMMLVADIARRLSIANPAFSPAEALQKGEGVVLIDEIEQHLHPRWQRLVLPALQATFPNVHFIATTHSPQVVSSVPRESVFILDNFQIKDYKPYTQGRDSNAILQDIFGVEKYTPHYKELIEKLYNLIDAEKAKEAKALLQELTLDWGEGDYEVKRAQMYIEDFL